MRRPPVDHIERTRAIYSGLGYPPYRWVRNEDPPPFVRLEQPLSECRVALIGSGGLYREGQVAFHFKDDASLRLIASSSTADELRATHFAYDLRAAHRDPFCVFPLRALRQLVENREIGSLADPAYAFMGGIYSARKVRDQLAPEIRRRCLQAEVDVALFVPV